MKTWIPRVLEDPAEEAQRGKLHVEGRNRIVAAPSLPSPSSGGKALDIKAPFALSWVGLHEWSQTSLKKHIGFFTRLAAFEPGPSPVACTFRTVQIFRELRVLQRDPVLTSSTRNCQGSEKVDGAFFLLNLIIPTLVTSCVKAPPFLLISDDSITTVRLGLR